MAALKKDRLIDDSQVFTTREFIESLQKINPEYGERKAYRTLENLQKRGRITKVSRGHYTFKITKRAYTYRPDAQMKRVIRAIERHFPRCDFQIWKLSQLNEFLEGHVHARLLYFRFASAFLSILPFFVSGMASICLMALGTIKEGSSAWSCSASASFSIEPT